jgi:hypothetical protein
MEYPGKYKAISTIADTEKQILQDFEDVWNSWTQKQLEHTSAWVSFFVMKVIAKFIGKEYTFNRLRVVSRIRMTIL